MNKSLKKIIEMSAVQLIVYIGKEIVKQIEKWWYKKNVVHLKSASNLNGNLNCSKELEHYAS